jgi:hypothetical protein
VGRVSRFLGSESYALAFTGAAAAFSVALLFWTKEREKSDSCACDRCAFVATLQFLS